ncbi:MAG: family hydrolase [Bacteriovoracaceae bacterium]|nr:family hydrolase [Bacteriovoracaceae bacterium]
MSKILAVAFDLDGVLVDAKEWHYKAFRRALNEHGFDILPEEHLAKFEGLPTRKKLEDLAERMIIPKKLIPIIQAEKQKYFLETARKYCHDNPRLRNILFQLQSSDRRLLVCSNAVRNTIETLLHWMGIFDSFDFYLSNEDVVLPKPSPEIYLKALHLLSVDPSELLVIEDHERGIEAAQKAGAHVLQIGSSEDLTIELIEETIQSIESMSEALEPFKKQPIPFYFKRQPSTLKIS